MNVVGELGTLPEQAELDLGLPDTAGEWLILVVVAMGLLLRLQ